MDRVSVLPESQIMRVYHGSVTRTVTLFPGTWVMESTGTEDTTEALASSAEAEPPVRRPDPSAFSSQAVPTAPVADGVSPCELPPYVAEEDPWRSFRPVDSAAASQINLAPAPPDSTATLVTSVAVGNEAVEVETALAAAPSVPAPALGTGLAITAAHDALIRAATALCQRLGHNGSFDVDKGRTVEIIP